MGNTIHSESFHQGRRGLVSVIAVDDHKIHLALVLCERREGGENYSLENALMRKKRVGLIEIDDGQPSVSSNRDKREGGREGRREGRRGLPFLPLLVARVPSPCSSRTTRHRNPPRSVGRFLLLFGWWGSRPASVLGG